jgi:predicted helicase
MEQKLNIKKSHKVIKDYYSGIKEQYDMGKKHEGAVAPVFASLLEHYGKKVGWRFSQQYRIKKLGSTQIPDGAFTNEYSMLEGIWEAKDDFDSLENEIKDKFNKGYPRFNIIFWQPKRIVIYQNGKIAHDCQISDNSENLVTALKIFFGFKRPHHEEWEKAIEDFKDNVPDLSVGLLEKIKLARKKNSKFIGEFKKFKELCQESINPNISDTAIEEMLIQHMLTRTILSKIFNLPGFFEKNVIAFNLEKLRQSLSSAYFSEADFLGKLDFFYKVIVDVASDITDFSEKQSFLNAIFERFFQGWATKTADRLGIIYTPQSVVDFMVNSVDELLKSEFGRDDGLSSKGVHIIDPFVGTGNFIMRVVDQIPKDMLPHKYKHELYCNEVQLMPYYIASMNIEHEYWIKTKSYIPFEGICFADTFQMFEDEHYLGFAQKENTERVKRQQEGDIFVVICNPPYNAHQVDENDNNKNRRYKKLEQEIQNTYSKSSKATNKNALSDPYVKAIKWASRRIGDEGVVAMITNNSFLEAYAFDGMRKHLEYDFDKIFTLDLGGNIRKCEGGNMNIFGIRVGVAITFFIKNKNIKKDCEILYYDMKTPTAEKKKIWLSKHKISDLNWKTITPNKNHTWLTEGIAEDFDEFLLMGDKKQKGKEDCDTIFNLYSRGVATSRDAWAYNFSKTELEKNMKLLIKTYNHEVERWKNTDPKPVRDGKLFVDDFVLYDDKKIKWSMFLKLDMIRERKGRFYKKKTRVSTYRPFSKRYLFLDRILNESVYRFPNFFPNPKSEKENKIITVNDISFRSNYSCLMLNRIPELHLVDSKDACQNFPFYTYNEDGTGRRENITDHSLKLYQTHYENIQPPNPPSKGGLKDDGKDPFLKGVRFSAGKSGGLQASAEKGSKKITKWDIFYYIYAMLHHPGYREEYKENLKRSLPRIPFASDFWRFASIGRKLADIHIGYESVEPYPLETIVKNKEFARCDFQVTKMKLPKDKKELIYNDEYKFINIPSEVYDYKLGNRSALEWIVDQYQVKVDKRSGIIQDPNNFDGDEKYIFDLVGKIVAVSLETVKLVDELSKLSFK